MTATQEPQTKRRNTKLVREVGLIGLMWASMGSIIGSGWLFGPQEALIAAGPAAIISWIIGGVAIVVLALVHAELGGMYPVSGGTARFPHYAFGGVAGASFGWFAWLNAATVAPIEVSAMLTYAGHYDFAKGWINPDTAGPEPDRDRGGDRPDGDPDRDQLPGRQEARRDQQRGDLVEDRDPAADDPGPGDRQLRHQQPHRGQRVQPRRPQGHLRGRLDRRHHLQLPRVRAGRPAGR